MSEDMGERASRGGLSRRDLLWLIGVVSAPVTVPVELCVPLPLAVTVLFTSAVLPFGPVAVPL